MSLKKSALLLMMLSILFLTIGATKDKKSAKAVENIMKRMKTPEKEMITLARKNLYKSSKFKAYATKLAADSKAMLRIKHPDKDFNDIAKDLDAEMKKLLDAVNKSDFNKIKKHWKESQKLCAECHDIYQDL